jgi:hypothetical protein
LKFVVPVIVSPDDAAEEEEPEPPQVHLTPVLIIDFLFDQLFQPFEYFE